MTQQQQARLTALAARGEARHAALGALTDRIDKIAGKDPRAVPRPAPHMRRPPAWPRRADTSEVDAKLAVFEAWCDELDAQIAAEVAWCDRQEARAQAVDEL
jgi:hypothetical protein